MRGQETELAKQERALVLMEQSKALENWAMKFDVTKKVQTLIDDLASDDTELLCAKHFLKLAVKGGDEMQPISHQGWKLAQKK